MASGERRLAATMFTDIVGYTHLSQANESLALEPLEEHKGVLRPTFSPYGGTEVKVMGARSWSVQTRGKDCHS